MADNFYKEDSIESLSPLEHVRLRPGVYAGDTTDATQLAIEILANAIDEFNIGHGNEIIIEYYPDCSNKITIKDKGQGFPINVMREDGETVLQAAFDVMNTSGKFHDDGVYDGVSVGLNGMGSKLTNFLSHYLEVVSVNSKGDGEKVYFEEGVFKNRQLFHNMINAQGTIVTFEPSEEFFNSPKVNTTKFRNFCEDITCLCPGLTIIYNNEEIHHEGIGDLLTRKLGEEESLLNDFLLFQEKQGKQKISVAMTYCGKSSSNITAYVNCGLTTAGPHITGIKSCITRTLNKWAREQGILKEKDKNLEGSALQEGLIFVCNITAEGVAYDAQVKSNVTRIDTSFISSFLGEQLEIWLDNNPGDGQTIIERALVARKAAEAAKKARAAVKAKASVVPVKKKAIQLPTTLTDCWSKDRKKCELLICEGKSAASGLVEARDSEFQAVYGVRGKMLSVLKTAASNIYKNQEINNLVQALGLPVNEVNCKLEYIPEKLRYGKIIAAADADPDGAAIENLLFNIIWYMCPELITNGHVYSAVPPLYRVTTPQNEYVYLKDDAALEEYKKKGKIKVLNRAKGLGEQDAEELSYCLLQPETRNILQLKVEDFGKTDNLFNALYGKAVEPRVKFLQEHGEEGKADYE